MKNEKLPDGYMTSDINLAAAMWNNEGVEFKSVEGEGKEKVFRLKGDPDFLESIKNKWFTGIPVIGNQKSHADKRRHLLGVLPR